MSQELFREVFHWAFDEFKGTEALTPEDAVYFWEYCFYKMC